MVRSKKGVASVVPTLAALVEEAEHIWGAEYKPEPRQSESAEAKSPRKEVAQDAHDREMDRLAPAALCLSGGGIRSAAFALGVLQGLAKLELLTKFQYLSTVSGGGYAGAWLSRWLAENADHKAENIQKALASTPEPAQLQWLRSFSNFLTPRPGLASSDTWTGLALVVRNLLLNWLLLLPLLLLVAWLPNVYQTTLKAVPPGWSGAVGWLGIALLFISTCLAAACVPSHKGPQFMKGEVGRRRAVNVVRWAIVAPALAWAFLLPLVVARPCPGCPDGAWDGWTPSGILWASFVASLLGFFAAVLVTGWQDRRSFFSANALVWTIVAFVGALALAGAALLPWRAPVDWSPEKAAPPVATISIEVSDALVLKPGPALPDGPQAPIPAESAPPPKVFPDLTLTLLATFGPLFVVLSHVLVSTLYVGFRALQSRSDPDREWLARVSAMQVRATLAWTVLAACALLLAPLLLDATAELGKGVAAVAAAGSAAFAVIGGKSSIVRLDVERGSVPGFGARSFSLLVTVATTVALVLLIAALARLELLAANWTAALAAAHLDLSLPPLAAHVVVAALAIILLWLASSNINVNRFSLHGIYRNRLVRGFLGAARDERPDVEPLTGFADRDNKRMHELRRSGPLFHIVNVALNLQRTENLRWLERKAASFVFTPLHSGSAILRGGRGAFANSRGYGGSERDNLAEPSGAKQAKQPAKGEGEPGVSLGTAMTISGAAANPGMGYHSRPATALLMTLFNVRLGAWLPNPAVTQNLERSYPTLSLRPILSEMLGLADETGKDLYLSDGGHFENLGLYEMVRRRCRYILVSDAGCDDKAVFADLGNAVRKVGVDFNVRITFENFWVGSRDPEKAAAAAKRLPFALARIVYPNSLEPGFLIYVKPSYLPGAPLDVRAYAEANRNFPHEPTSDQWFSESQFESYRRLGEHTLLDHVAKGLTGRAFPTAREFFEAVFDREGELPRPARAAE